MNHIYIYTYIRTLPYTSCLIEIGTHEIIFSIVSKLKKTCFLCSFFQAKTSLNLKTLSKYAPGFSSDTSPSCHYSQFSIIQKKQNRETPCAFSFQYLQSNVLQAKSETKVLHDFPPHGINANEQKLLQAMIILVVLNIPLVC